MLELKNVNKSFEDTLVLKNISLTFEENQTTVIVGPSGSGKSTLLRCMNLLETPEFGSLKMGHLFIEYDKEISPQTKQALRRNTAMVFQSFNLFSHLTAVENVMEGPVQVLKKDKQEAAATLLNELNRYRKRLEDSESFVFSGVIAGSVGTYATMGERGPEIERRVLKELGLSVPDVFWHTQPAVKVRPRCRRCAIRIFLKRW